VEPVYASGSDEIRAYRETSGRERLATGRVRALDLGFIRSQFWYYRGERAPGGLLARRPQRDGLAASERALATSVRLCPENPLAVYMLGRVSLDRGEAGKARRLIARACALYTQAGWLPRGPKMYLRLANQPGSRRERAGA
jgi:hypothetical protein